jgi:RNA polymerase sigma-70 factor, ECF subfamily
VSQPQSHEITQLLHAWRAGDQSAFDRLVPLVYEQLRQMAKRYMKREAPGHTLQTTALVNEAYLRLVGQHEVEWQDRTHFFAVAAQAMRRLLIDRARARHYVKRGGGARRVTLDEVVAIAPEPAAELLALDEALTRLAALDPRQSRIVELRYFGGLTIDETAEVLGVSAITVTREWTKAKGWLYRELSKSSDEG